MLTYDLIIWSTCDLGVVTACNGEESLFQDILVTGPRAPHHKDIEDPGVTARPGNLSNKRGASLFTRTEIQY